jgi:hypothetical protein
VELTALAPVLAVKVQVEQFNVPVLEFDKAAVAAPAVKVEPVIVMVPVEVFVTTAEVPEATPFIVEFVIETEPEEMFVTAPELLVALKLVNVELFTLTIPVLWLTIPPCDPLAPAPPTIVALVTEMVPVEAL